MTHYKSLDMSGEVLAECVLGVLDMVLFIYNRRPLSLSKLMIGCHKAEHSDIGILLPDKQTGSFSSVSYPFVILSCR